MRIILFSRQALILLSLFIGSAISGQTKSVDIDSSFTKVELWKIASTYSSNDIKKLDDYFWSTIKSAPNIKGPIFYKGVDSNLFLGFNLNNTQNSTVNLILNLSSTLIYEIFYYEVIDGEIILKTISGSKYPTSTRLKNHRNFAFHIELKANENKSIFLRFKTLNTSLAVSGSLSAQNIFEKDSMLEYLIIGIFLGLIIFSMLLSLFVYGFIRNTIFLAYAFYLVFLALCLSVYLGFFFQYFDSILHGYNLHFFVLSILLAFASFVIFTQKLLNSKVNFPALHKFINYILIIVIGLRLPLFILPSFYYTHKLIILQAWYVSITLLIAAIIIEIILSLKYQKKAIAFFSIGFFSILIGMLITVFYYQMGLFNSYFFGLPILLFASILEIILLTISMAYIFKEVFLERKLLSQKVKHQQQKIISSFLDGEEKERKRIGLELHDNIGSKLSYLSHGINSATSQKDIKEQLTEVFKDVRNLSHQITPANFKMVGLIGALKDLTISFSELSGINVDFQTYDLNDNLSEELCLNVYRITQEALNNIAKHSKATHVDIQLVEITSEINLSIEDNGIGFILNNERKGIGLQNINSRAQQLNASISIDSIPNSGTTILLSIPKK